MLAQCWVDFDSTIDVLGFVNGQDFPYATLILSTTLVSLSASMIVAILMM